MRQHGICHGYARNRDDKTATEPMKSCLRKNQRQTRSAGRQSVSATKTSATADALGKKRHSYKPLPTRFRHDGFDYRLICREGDGAIYEQKWSGCANPSICYEVIRVRKREGFRIGGRFVEPSEVYPKAEAWGVDGFTLTDRDAAFKKFREICG